MPGHPPPASLASPAKSSAVVEVVGIFRDEKANRFSSKSGCQLGVFLFS
jgi:hypothetical protein